METTTINKSVQLADIGALPSLPDSVALRFRRDSDVATWLLKAWHQGFADGNELADALCKPISNAGLTFAGDVDELLRALAVGAFNEHDKSKVGAGWLVQGKWTAHLTEFGQSRSALLGSFSGVSFRDIEGGHARFHASCYGFTPVRDCHAYREFVTAWGRVELPRVEVRTEKLAAGDRVRLTTKFLTNTGQRGTDEACRVWTLQPCQCKNGRTVAVDQERVPMPDGSSWFTAEELAASPCLKWRHILAANLRRA